VSAVDHNTLGDLVSWCRDQYRDDRTGKRGVHLDTDSQGRVVIELYEYDLHATMPTHQGIDDDPEIAIGEALESWRLDHDRAVASEEEDDAAFEAELCGVGRI